MAQQVIDLATAAAARPARVASGARTDRRVLISAVEPSRRAQRRAYSPTLALVIGFVAGSVFWHFVGFWDFVGRIVFHTPRHEATVAAERIGGLKTRKEYGHVAAAEPDIAVVPTGEGAGEVVANCTTLVRDPASGELQSQACPAGSVTRRATAAISRGDLARLPDAGGEQVRRSAWGGEGPTQQSAGTAAGATSGWSTVTSTIP